MALTAANFVKKKGTDKKTTGDSKGNALLDWIGKRRGKKSGKMAKGGKDNDEAEE